MSITDQNFTTPSAGQADWDTDLNANFTIIARGYHVRGTVGEAVNTGDILTVTSDGFYRKYNPSSDAMFPRALAFTSANSGAESTFVAKGIVRSLGIYSTAYPGADMFVSAATPGVIVPSYSAAHRPIGFGVQQDGIMFDPGRALFPELITRVVSVAAVTGSSHLVSFDGGRGGFIRRIHMDGSSADLVTLQLWSNSSRANRLYETISGGVTVVGTFVDQAGVPYFNSDTSTLSGLIYGTLKIESASAVGSDSIGITIDFERFR